MDEEYDVIVLGTGLTVCLITMQENLQFDLTDRHISGSFIFFIHPTPVTQYQ